MKKYLVFSLLISIGTLLHSQSILGTWITVSDDDGKEKSHVQIYEQNGLVYGKIIKGLDDTMSPLCEACKGDLHNAPMIGLEIIKNMKHSGDKWTDGKILDPLNGKEYKCTLSLESADVLKVRGYIGFSLIGRTQKWKRFREL